MAEASVRQQTNSQAQAGAAAQLIVNIFLVTVDGQHWTVKPIAFHVDRVRQSAAAHPSDAAGGGDRTEVEVAVASRERSSTRTISKSS